MCRVAAVPQVPRILNPLVLVLEELPTLCRDPKVRCCAVGQASAL